MNKIEARLRPSRKTRLRIAEQRATRLVVSRSNCHIYAQIVAPSGDKVLASASTLEAEGRKDVKNGGNKEAGAVGDRQAHRRTRQGNRRRVGRVRSLGLPLSRSRASAGRCGARARPQVLTRRRRNAQGPHWRERSNGS